MKKSAVLAVVGLLCALGLGYHWAHQGVAGPPRPAETSAVKTGMPPAAQSSRWVAPSRAMARRAQEMERLMRKLERSSASSSAVGGGVEERMELLDALAKAYYDTGFEAFRPQISAAFTRSLAVEQNLDVAAAIALKHAGLDFDENTLPNLHAAYARKPFSVEAYHETLARIYRDTPEGLRGELVAEISTSGHRYVAEIVAAGITEAHDIALSAGEVSSLQLLLSRHKPDFGAPADALGYSDAIFHTHWLIAVARLQNKAGGIGVEQYLGKQLLDPATDPRAAVAFLISAYAAQLDASQRQALQWAAVHARARDFIRRHPQSASLQQLGQEIVAARTP